MLKGLDTNQALTAFAGELAGLGYEFAMRYYRRLPYPRDRSCLGNAERAALHDAGLAVGVVFQHKSNAVAEFTDHNAKTDGDAALARAKELQQPTESAIYLAFDTDFVAANVHVAVRYGAIWAAIVKGAGYGTGVYGDRDALAALTAEHREGWGDLFDHRWLTNAKAWGQTDDWDIRQTSTPFTVLPGLSIDNDEAKGAVEAGLWVPS